MQTSQALNKHSTTELYLQLFCNFYKFYIINYLNPLSIYPIEYSLDRIKKTPDTKLRNNKVMSGSALPSLLINVMSHHYSSLNFWTVDGGHLVFWDSGISWYPIIYQSSTPSIFLITTKIQKPEAGGSL